MIQIQVFGLNIRQHSAEWTSAKRVAHTTPTSILEPFYQQYRAHDGEVVKRFWNVYSSKLNMWVIWPLSHEIECCRTWLKQCYFAYSAVRLNGPAVVCRVLCPVCMWRHKTRWCYWNMDEKLHGLLVTSERTPVRSCSSRTVRYVVGGALRLSAVCCLVFAVCTFWCVRACIDSGTIELAAATATVVHQCEVC